jgi:ABC-type glycerol-3-phosphate transport system permease component
MVKHKKIGVFDMVNTSLIVIFLIITIYPLYYVLCASFSNIYDLINTPVPLWPAGFNLDAYKKVFETKEIWTGLRNSVFYTFFGTCLNIAMTLVAAFPLSIDSLPGRKWIMKLITLTMYISGGIIPSYLIVSGLGMRNTPFALIIPGAVSVYLIIISISFFKSTIPSSILEAARIDGCGYISAFARIVVPLSTPLVGVLAFQYGLGHWNSYASALIYIKDRALYPIQLILREILISADLSSMMNDLLSQVFNADFEKQMAVAEGVKYVSMVISSIPLLAIYPFLNKYFARGLVLGGVKE